MSRASVVACLVLLLLMQVPLRELDKEASGGGKPVSKDLPLVLAPLPDSGDVVQHNSSPSLSRKSEVQQPTLHISMRVTRRGDAAKEHTSKQQVRTFCLLVSDSKKLMWQCVVCRG